MTASELREIIANLPDDMLVKLLAEEPNDMDYVRVMRERTSYNQIDYTQRDVLFIGQKDNLLRHMVQVTVA